MWQKGASRRGVQGRRWGAVTKQAGRAASSRTAWRCLRHKRAHAHVHAAVRRRCFFGRVHTSFDDGVGVLALACIRETSARASVPMRIICAFTRPVLPWARACFACRSQSMCLSRDDSAAQPESTHDTGAPPHLRDPVAILHKHIGLVRNACGQQPLLHITDAVRLHTTAMVGWVG